MSESIPSEFWQGVEQFNHQAFYDCHDTLEALWMDAMQPDKTFYQGVLQIAVALYHLGNYNQRGALTLLGEGIRRLSGYQPEYGEIRVEPLVQDSHVLLQVIQHLNPDQIPQFAEQLFSQKEISLDALSVFGIERDGAIALPRIERIAEPSATSDSAD
jgi:predicted metal-dependent hydrolase